MHPMINNTNWVAFERRVVPEVVTLEMAYEHLSRVFSARLPMFAVLNATEIGFDLNSEESQQIVAMHGFAVHNHPYFIELHQDNGRVDTYGYHRDGYVGRYRQAIGVHYHTPKKGRATGVFVPMRETLPGAKMQNYIDFDAGTLHPRYYQPVVYEANEIIPGYDLFFTVAGKNALAHELTTDQSSDGERSAKLTFINRIF